MKAPLFFILFASFLAVGCATEKKFPPKKSDLKFSIVVDCDKGEEKFSMSANIENKNLVALVRAPLTCGLQTVNPQYERWEGNDLITLSVETYYNGQDLALCYCWRTMKFELPAESYWPDVFPKKIYFIQDKTVMGDIILNVIPTKH